MATGSVFLCIHLGTNEHRGRGSSGTMKWHLASEEAWEMPQALVVFLENHWGPELQAEDVRHGDWKLSSAGPALFISSYVGLRARNCLFLEIIDSRGRARFPCNQALCPFSSCSGWRVGGGAASFSGQAHQPLFSRQAILIFLLCPLYVIFHEYVCSA